MEVTALLTSFIYVVSSALLIPVLIALSAGIVWMVVYAGSFFGMAMRRRRLFRSEDPVRDILQASYGHCSKPVRECIERMISLRQHQQPEIATVNLLRETEQRFWSSLDHLKILVRVGPGLGLIGTLIPMGTGLAALGQGDVTRLSSDLVIAFTTTVVGMGLGLVSYCFLVIEQRWVEDDVKNIELAAELLAGQGRATTDALPVQSR